MKRRRNDIYTQHTHTQKQINLVVENNYFFVFRVSDPFDKAKRQRAKTSWILCSVTAAAAAVYDVRICSKWVSVYLYISLLLIFLQLFGAVAS